jgi:hypothetical protein
MRSCEVVNKNWGQHHETGQGRFAPTAVGISQVNKSDEIQERCAPERPASKSEGEKTSEVAEHQYDSRDARM